VDENVWSFVVVARKGFNPMLTSTRRFGDQEKNESDLQWDRSERVREQINKGLDRVCQVGERKRKSNRREKE
jgi:hypothetical protein